MTDGLGRPLQVGDKIARIVGGRGCYRFEEAVVEKITAKMIGIKTIQWRWIDGKYQKAEGISNIIPEKVIKI